MKKITLTTSISINNSTEGERIEEKIQRITLNKEPITDGAPLIYTDRKDGVKAEMNIRTDRFELAVEAMDKVTKSHLAKREQRHKPKGEKQETKPGDEKTGKAAIEGMKKEGSGDPSQ